MSDPATKMEFSPFCAIGIYRAPAHVSKQEFDSSMRGFGAAIQTLAAAQDSVLKFSMVYQNDRLAKSIQGAGLPEAPATVMVTAECTSAAHLQEYLRDPEIVKRIHASESFGLHSGASAFSADVVTKIDKGFRGQTCHGIFIFKVPRNIPVDEYHTKVEGMVDKFVALPIAKEHLVKHTMWLQNDILAKDITEAWRFPDEDKHVVVMLECDSWTSVDEFLTHQEVKKIIAAAMDEFGLHVDSNCFSADVETLIYKYEE